MAGHSKWSKIKRDKASNDAKRGALFTKLGNQIAVAARSGVDPKTNTNLAIAIETAKSFNMPNTTIKRALKRASDKKQAQLEEVLYEGYGRKGLALLIECATDNRRRTYPEVRSTLVKNGGRIADPGAVAFNFKRCGEIIVEADDEETILAVLELGIDDFMPLENNLFSLLTTSSKLHRVLRSLKADGQLKIKHAGLTYLPKIGIELEATEKEKAQKLIEALENLSDVINVYSNWLNA